MFWPFRRKPRHIPSMESLMADFSKLSAGLDALQVAVVAKLASFPADQQPAVDAAEAKVEAILAIVSPPAPPAPDAPAAPAA
jgi:hypothetical protein